MKAFSPEFGADAETAEQDYVRALHLAQSATYPSNATSKLRHAELFRRTGNSTSAGELLREAMTEASSFLDVGWLCWSKGNLGRQTGNLSGAIVDYRAATRFAKLSGDRVLHFYARAGEAETYRVLGAFEFARVYHARLLSEAQSMRDVRAVVWAMQGLAQIARNCGDIRLARRLFAHSARLASDASDIRGLGYALRGLGDTSSLLGFHNAGLTRIREAKVIFSQCGAKQSLAYAVKAESDVYLRMGRLDSAEEAIAVGQSLFLETGDTRGKSFLDLNLARAYIARTEWSGAEQSLQFCRASLRSTNVSHGLARLRHVTASFLHARPKLVISSGGLIASR
ncbi:MAG: hypothetical protein JNL19_12385 [Burkholderiales bacterium]|nr:hypothetical protein [Burkholderiales bacterium]